MHGVKLHCIVYSTSLNRSTPQCTAAHYTSMHYNATNCTALYCTGQHSTTLHCTALHCPTLHCTAFHRTGQYSAAVHCSAAPHNAIQHAAPSHGSPLTYYIFRDYSIITKRFLASIYSHQNLNSYSFTCDNIILKKIYWILHDNAYSIQSSRLANVDSYNSKSEQAPEVVLTLFWCDRKNGYSLGLHWSFLKVDPERNGSYELLVPKIALWINTDKIHFH